MHATRWIAVATLFLGLALPAAAGAQAPTDLEQRVDRIFSRWNNHQSPGCAVAADVGGRTVLSRAYGMADLEHGVPNRPATIFEAGSVSKQFTAAAIMLLVLDGSLSLDDDVRMHVPELPEYGAPITIRHLVNHTSGLRDWGSVAAIAGWSRSDRAHTHEHVLDILARQSALNYSPGAAYSYTNSGYNLMAVIVERVSGTPFAEFSRTRIFEPLGLADTQWRDDYRRVVPGRSTAYAARGADFISDRPNEYVHGNGGLLTTVADLLRWDRALAGGQLGGRELVRLMHTRGVLNDGEEISYAGGLMIGTRHGVPQVSHTGATGGYRAFLARYPEQDLSVAVLCNLGSVSPGGVGEAVADVFLAEIAQIDGARAVDPAENTGEANGDEQTYAPTPAELAAYTGTYHSPDAETTLSVTVEDGRLVLHRRPGARFGATPVEPGVFRTSLGLIRFHRGDDGAVSHLGLRQARVHDLRFQRVES